MALIDFLLTQQCTITPWIREAEGEDVYGQPETRACRIQADRRLDHTYVNPRGALDQVHANNSKMFCRGAIIPTRSKVECDGQEYIVVKCYQARGFKESHLEVLLQ